MADALTAFAIGCSPRPSSTDRMLPDTLAALAPHGVAGAWPGIRARLLRADCTPAPSG